MRQHARIVGLSSVPAGVVIASVTRVVAAPRTGASPTPTQPAGSIVSVTYALPNSIQTPGWITCPVKKGAQTLPLSGGALLQTDSLEASINSSYPTAHGWTVDVNNTSGEASQYAVYAVYAVCAVCAKRLMGYVQVVSPATANPAGFVSQTGTTCPRGEFVTGGGAHSNSRSTLAQLNGLWPDSTNIWDLSINNFSSVNALVTSSAVCAKLARSKTSYEYLPGAEDNNPAGQETATQAVCPTGLAVLGGGTQSLGPATSVSVNSTFPFTGGWIGDVSNTGSNSTTVTTFIVCAN